MPTARLSLQVVLGPDGLIYAIGGRDANTIPLTVVEALDPVSGTWTTAPSLSTARYWFAATVAHDGRIFAIGGVGNLGFLDDVEALTIGTGWAAAPSLPENRAWLSAAVTADGRVLAIGGSTDNGTSSQPPPLSTMFAYQPTSNVWSP
jgi:N-acetylneuraminic acid mutarotase